MTNTSKEHEHLEGLKFCKKCGGLVLTPKSTPTTSKEEQYQVGLNDGQQMVARHFIEKHKYDWITKVLIFITGVLIGLLL